MEKSFDFVGLGFCSNDYLCILPYIPLDNKVKIIKRLIQGGGARRATRPLRRPNSA